jgi:crotonobetainyl-CoA:carnitine CoA-transferase CaiB-like acyl-CoA transferase
LLVAADIVIESSRPAALRRRQLGADDVPARTGRIWLRINGYRDQPDRPAFGDDAAVAGGLVGAAADGPVFCGDAIADPLSGLEAARAVGESLRRGGAEVIDVSMAQVAARYAALPLSTGGAAYADLTLLAAAVPSASALGADNAVVQRLVAERSCTTC